MSEYLTTGQAADILGVSDDSIRRYLEARLLDGHKTPGGVWRVDAASARAMRNRVTRVSGNLTTIKGGQ